MPSVQLFEIIEVFRKTWHVEWERNLVVWPSNGYIEKPPQTNFPRFLAFFLAHCLKWVRDPHVNWLMKADMKSGQKDPNFNQRASVLA